MTDENSRRPDLESDYARQTGATVHASKILDLTIGRVTNDQMEQARAVWFKDEGDDGAERIGPVYLDVPETSGGRSPNLIPFNKGEVEWFPFSVAEELARELGVEVVYS